MNFKEIQELIRQIDRTNLTEFKLSTPDFKIKIRTNKGGAKEKTVVQSFSTSQMPSSMPIAQPMATSTPPSTSATSEPAAEKPATTATAPSSEDDMSNYKAIKSPMVGTFYRSAGPDKPPYIKIGDKVSAGTVVCIIEAMKLFNEIESEISGTVVKVMVDDSSPVEYDQVLFYLDTK
ncbi:MAG: acetyl-CoA carboxylase biotin carboxyl carrier protein [Saprospiraceae bacterium]|nr:acetyl-CoA carboxylase biotin carboxyl carrier protein [Saprospiraceae bacterium]